MNSTKLFGAIVVISAFLFMSFAVWAYSDSDTSMLQFVVALATIIMAHYVALQTMVTAQAAHQAAKQAELMNESLLEMKKQRMDIEFMKNEIIGYIDAIEATLKFNLQVAHPQGMAGNEMGLYLSWSEVPSLQERGIKLRINNKIQKLLKRYNIDLETYNALVKKINADTTEIIRALEADSTLNTRIFQISKETSEKLNKKKVVAPKDIIRELVLQFKRETDKIEPPRYERLGLDINEDRLYRLELWERAKKVFAEYLINNNIPIYNKLLEREENLKKLKTRTVSLLEKVRKMKEELLQSEKRLEEEIMGL